MKKTIAGGCVGAHKVVLACVVPWFREILLNRASHDLDGLPSFGERFVVHYYVLLRDQRAYRRCELRLHRNSAHIPRHYWSHCSTSKASSTGMTLSELHSIFERQVGAFFTFNLLKLKRYFSFAYIAISISLIVSFGQLFRISILHRRVLMRFNLLQQKFDLPFCFRDSDLARKMF